MAVPTAPVGKFQSNRFGLPVLVEREELLVTRRSRVSRPRPLRASDSLCGGALRIRAIQRRGRRQPDRLRRPDVERRPKPSAVTGRNPSHFDQKVDLERGALVLTQGKTGREIEIPLHPEFKRWLSDRAGANKPRSGAVFLELRGIGTRGRTGLSGQFAAIMKKAKIVPKVVQAKGKNGRKRSSLSFHSLRHSFNSAMANAGVTQEIRQRLTGHASKAINDRYTHAELETLRKAVGSVPTLN